jgi:CrcB protein
MSEESQNSSALYEETPVRRRQGGEKRKVIGLMTYFVIGTGGFIGANVRFLIGRWAVQRWGAAFPYGTLIINVAGCFILGLFATLATRLAWNDAWRLLIAVGFVGAFTTFSTFEYETFELVGQGNMLRALANLLGSIAFGFSAVFLGVVLARLLLRVHA